MPQPSPKSQYMNLSNHNRLAYVECGIMVLVFYLFNVFTPYVADDFAFAYSAFSLSNIPNALHGLYFGWSGRIVAHFFAYFWLSVGKDFFDVANTLVYCAFIYLVAAHISVPCAFSSF